MKKAERYINNRFLATTATTNKNSSPDLPDEIETKGERVEKGRKEEKGGDREGTAQDCEYCSRNTRTAKKKKEGAFCAFFLLLRVLEVQNHSPLFK